MAISSRGPGRRPLTAETRVRIPVSLPRIFCNSQTAFLKNFPKKFLSKGIAPGTSALAPGNLIRPYRILGCHVVSKFLRAHIVIANVQGAEQVGHRIDHS